MKGVMIIGLLFMSMACSPVPQDIHYGKDTCSSCLMTIVDQQHAAELVTTKGKAFKFDAIECMVRYLKEHEGTEYAFTLVNDYNKPGSFINAETATFLISPSVPSPMGAFLSAFASEDQAMKLQQEKAGKLYDWSTLRLTLK